ncbi:MAG: 50S ribosomal protein L25/general stress protein Ctc, partial [Ottowia sp.]|nr:50S ribosomal protein L25/general stress protein Ctc [Ottowia sp.]
MQFNATERKTQGTGASRRLRNAGRVPGIVYGGEGQPQMIDMDHNEMWQAIHKPAFHTSVLDMNLDGKSSQVLLRDVQMHPYRQQIVHMDFLRVAAGQKINLRVPLQYKGQEESPAVKKHRCVVNIVTNAVEVSCLPADLPECIEVDLSKLKPGDRITLADVKLPGNVQAVTHGNSIASVTLVSV